MTATLTEQTTAAPTRWSVNGAESSVEFAVKTFWGLATVRGRFDRFDGSCEVGPDGTTIELTIDADSLDTGNTTRDEHLRPADFFGAEDHPEVRFTSSRVHHVTDRILHVVGTSKRRARLCRSSSQPPCSRSTTRSRSRQASASTPRGSG